MEYGNREALAIDSIVTGSVGGRSERCELYWSRMTNIISE